ncbi:hypothetical protein BpHYR1_044268 [Brachionus plicatilis]|uniref:Uncharacterized protein n=1 Tax=Brachionus plicatilis TaxID=10195 RepID=A0A3M7RFF5_BRAPC|nr:hypothetical protein BpHYR1_044268 [Brachionus plicatilis]
MTKLNEEIAKIIFYCHKLILFSKPAEREKIFKISLKYGMNKGDRFRLGNNSGVDDQLDAVTSVSGRSRCSKKF